MIQWAQFADEIFGVESNICVDPTLTRCALRMEHCGVRWVALIDDAFAVLAASTVDDGLLAFLRDQTRTWTPLTDDWESTTRRQAGEEIVRRPVKAGEQSGWVVVGRSSDVVPGSDWNSPASFLILVCEQWMEAREAYRGLARSDEALRQLRSQFQTVEEDHRQLLLANLREHNARLENQAQYVQSLESVVRLRTRELTATTEQLAVKNSQLEETNNQLKMQIQFRRRSERSLRESMRETRRLALVASKTSNLVLLLDKSGCIEWANDSFVTASEHPLDEIVGLDPLSLLKGAETSVESIAFMRDQMKQGRPVGCDLRHYTRTGRAFWNAVEVRPVFSDQGEVTGYIFIGIDVTQQLQTAIHLKAAKEAAENATRMKAEFLANMSHEIRSPLTAILGHSDILINEGDLEFAPPARVRSLYAIQRNGTHLQALVDDILDFSKIEAGELRIESVECSPHSLIQQVVQSARPKTAEKNIALSASYLNPIPNLISSDPTRLRQILHNLVSNAVKFTHRGSVQIEADFLEKDGRQTLELSVVDTGLGMSVEQQRMLFRPFQQGDASLTRQYGGTGLGLSITKKLVELLGGYIRVESAPGVGSRFSAVIPVVAAPDVARQAEPMNHPYAELKAASSGLEELFKRKIKKRILLVEDREENQELILYVLRNAGADVDAASNGMIALEKASADVDHRGPYDVVLMDMQMPLMDGRECTRRMRKIGFQGRIVALTAHATREDEVACVDAGCDGYLSKPIDWERLFDAISQNDRTGGGRRDAAPPTTPFQEPDACPVVPPYSAAPATENRLNGADDVVESPEETAEVFDWPQLLQRCIGSEELARRLASRFPNQVTADLVSVAMHVKNGDFDQAEIVAHGVKGTAANLAMSRIGRVAGALESLLRGKSAQGVSKLLADLQTEAEAVRRRLEAMGCNLSATVARREVY